MENVQQIEDFNGVYLLCSKSEILKYRHKVYIGFTVNPNRRINQHNKGRLYGGAKRTDSRGPWEMVMIIHGFPSNISALRFEWAWQQPTESRRLKNISGIQRRKSGESNFEYKFRVLAEMLRIGPWSRLPLTIRWLSDDFERIFPIGKSPPLHMPICHGRVKIKAISKQSQMEKALNDIRTPICEICSNFVQPDLLISCVTPNCRFVGHLKCLAKSFLEPGQYVPIEGMCPCCKRTNILWGDLIRKKNGCSDLEKCEEYDSEDEIGKQYFGDTEDEIETL